MPRDGVALPHLRNALVVALQALNQLLFLAAGLKIKLSEVLAQPIAIPVLEVSLLCPHIMLLTGLLGGMKFAVCLGVLVAVAALLSSWALGEHS